jgi:hypothetical protein
MAIPHYSLQYCIINQLHLQILFAPNWSKNMKNRKKACGTPDFIML